MWDLTVSVPDHCLSFYFMYGDSVMTLFFRSNMLRPTQQFVFIQVLCELHIACTVIYENNPHRVYDTCSKTAMHTFCGVWWR